MMRLAFDLESLLSPSVTILSRAFASALLCCVACAKAPEAPPPRAAAAAAPVMPATPTLEQQVDAAARGIDAGFLRTQIAQLSSDAFEGRGPATKGDHAARAYLIDQLKALGLRPGVNGTSWEQPFDILGVSSKVPEKWTFAKGGKSLPLTWNTQFIAANGGEAAKVAVKDAELVFVGYGIQAPEYQWDDFKGQDLKGKILLMLNNDPDWDPALFEGTRRLYYGRWTYKYESAARQGAVGAIIIHTTPSAGYPFSVVQSSWSGTQFKLPSDGEKHIEVQAWVTEDAARALAKLAGQELDKLVTQAKSRDFKPVPLGVKTSLAFDSTIERAQTANVLGVLPADDKSDKRDEYVIYTAHHDHLGIAKADEHGDAIYNGALDNAAGCAEVLAIARAWKALTTPPRRSIMFLFVGAEEQGLLGSRYFAEHPTVPAGKIAVDVNYDGANIWGRTQDVTFIGKGKSSLDATLQQLTAAQGRKLVGDQFPDRGHYYRSDQFSFAKIGVPAIYLDTGTSFIGRPEGWGREQVEAYEAQHYHQPSDQLTPEWNFDGMIEDVQLGFRAGVAVANQDALPSWVAGDEFEAARKAAIAAAQAR